MAEKLIVAVALLTRADVERLGGTLARIWPIDDSPCFEELLAAIDEAERQHQAAMPRSRQSKS